MSRKLRLSLWCALLLSTASSVGAQDATTPFANEISQSKRAADEGRDMISLLEFNAKEAGDLATTDLAEAKKFFTAYSAAWDKTRELFEQQKREEGWKAWNEASGLYQGRERWRERIGARQEQAKTAPTEQSIASERQGVPPESAAAFDKFIEASKGVSDAWGKYAESLTPIATDADIRVARQGINVAQSEREIAMARFFWSRENRELYVNRGVSKELDEKLKALEQVENDIEKTRRVRVELDGKLEMGEIARRTLIDDTRNTANAVATKIREDAERNKK